MISDNFPERLKRSYWQKNMDPGSPPPDTAFLVCLDELENAHSDLGRFGRLPTRLTDLEQYQRWKQVYDNYLVPLLLDADALKKRIAGSDISQKIKTISSVFQKYDQTLREVEQQWKQLDSKAIHEINYGMFTFGDGRSKLNDLYGYLNQNRTQIGDRDFTRFLECVHIYLQTVKDIYDDDFSFFSPLIRNLFRTGSADDWLRPFSSLADLTSQNYRRYLQSQIKLSKGEGRSMTDTQMMAEIIQRHRRSARLVRNFIACLRRAEKILAATL